MNLHKTFIQVFITKNMKFRARIKEPNQPAYEVSVNGASWTYNGKGRKYEQIIRDKMKQIIETLQSRLIVA